MQNREKKNIVKDEQLIEINKILQTDEKLISTHKPHKISYLLQSLLRLLIVVILCIASCIISYIVVYLSGLFVKGYLKILLIISFLIIFQTPLWLHICKFTNTVRRFKFVEYFITNERVIIKKGLLLKTITSIYFTDVYNIKVTFSPINEYFKTADVKIATYHKWTILHSLLDYYEVGRYLEEACNINVKQSKKYSKQKDNQGQSNENI